MQVLISGRHVSLSDHEKSVIQEKFEKYQRKLHNELTKIEVVINVEKDRHSIEAILHIAHNNPLVGHASADNNLAAVDIVIGKLDNLVAKHVGKHHGHKAENLQSNQF